MLIDKSPQNPSICLSKISNFLSLAMFQPLITKLITAAKLFTSKPPPLCSFLFLIVISVATFYTLHHPSASPRTDRNYQNVLGLRRYFLSAASNATISSYLRALTLHPHLAGTKPSLDAVHYVQSHFQSFGLDSHIAEYDVLLSYPAQASVSAYFSNDTAKSLDLNEAGVSDSGDSRVVRPYHAYSPSGSAQGKVVFVNYGREEDYRALEARGVNVSGCVVLARKGNALSRGSVVRIAEAEGALGVLLYADGRDRLGGVERGTVMKGIGDPLSPGWPSAKGEERLGFEASEVLKRFPRIPSLPLSLDNANAILGSLGGYAIPQEWRYSGQVGPGPTVVNLTYQGEKRMAKIHNVFAVIRGFEEPDRYVLLGNHRDAWTYGAVDPNSGTAALLDVARRYSLLLKAGWKPRRTILLCSWDAEEFGMIGSTEWVEENLLNLGANAVAYLNVDCAVQGPGFFAGATPQLDSLLFDVTKKVQDPDVDGSTIYETWKAANKFANIERLARVDSDFAPFLQHAGIPSIDMYYGEDYPVFHTAFDSFEWMIKHADPMFHRHVAVAGIWGLLALHLADEPIIPFNYISYAEQLEAHRDVLSNWLYGSVSLDPLTTSIQELLVVAKQVEDEVKRLRNQDPKDDLVASKIRALNDRLMLAERGFLEADGIKGSEWFKHLVYGPHTDPVSKLDFFPGIADSISLSLRMKEKKDADTAIQHEIWRVARAIRRTARALKGLI